MNIYFSGIGGTGIGPLAMLAQDAGYGVFGSDMQRSPVYGDLTKRGVPVSTDQSGDFMQSIYDKNGIDLFVYTAGLPADHAELKLASELNITAVKRDKLLDRLLGEKSLKLIAVSGTHGKTTTTGMLIWAMQRLKTPVSYSIGTRLDFGPPARYEKNSEYFIYEADEFDKNMLKFKPFLSVITSVDFDHADTYGSREQYRDAFQQFIDQSEQGVAWKESGLMSEKLEFCEDISPGVTLAGRHNRANATLVLRALQILFPSAEYDELLAVINSFPGTMRRFEKIAPNLFTDYAHHPAEIAATIELAREINDNVVVVYQPHQNIRQHQLLDSAGYKGCFNSAKKVYWLPTYLSREDAKLRILPPELLIESAKDDTSVDFIPAEMDNDLQESIKNDLDNNALAVAMSAGDLDDWVRKLAGNI